MYDDVIKQEEDDDDDICVCISCVYLLGAVSFLLLEAESLSNLRKFY